MKKSQIQGDPWPHRAYIPAGETENRDPKKRSSVAMEMKAKEKKTVIESVRFESCHFRYGGQGWLSWGDFGIRI